MIRWGPALTFALHLHTPPPNLIGQTGSSDLLVAEVGCDGCPAGTVQYAPLLSKTVKNVSCTGPRRRPLLGVGSGALYLSPLFAAPISLIHPDPDFNCKTCVDSHCYFNNTYETYVVRLLLYVVSLGLRYRQ